MKYQIISGNNFVISEADTFDGLCKNIKKAFNKGILGFKVRKNFSR